jgi:hypothetical protein
LPADCRDFHYDLSRFSNLKKKIKLMKTREDNIMANLLLYLTAAFLLLSSFESVPSVAANNRVS